MTRFGDTLMTEQSGPKELVDYAVSAERVGFDFEVSSDHSSTPGTMRDAVRPARGRRSIHPVRPGPGRRRRGRPRVLGGRLHRHRAGQIGGDTQELFLKEAAGPLLDKLRAESK